MEIGGIDQKNSARRVKVYQKSNLRLLEDDPQPSTSGLQAVFGSSSSSPQNESSDTDFFELPPVKKSRIPSKKLKNVATVADRAKVSDRQAALIVSATLEDYNIISSEDVSGVIDKNKIRRARSRCRQEFNKSADEVDHVIQALYFDGKKDNTITAPRDAPKSVTKTVVEEHYTLIEEPGSKYLGHLKPRSGLAADICSVIAQFLEEKSCDLVAVGCDGTVTNTGE